MTQTRRLTGYRFAELRFGETLQRLAQRELGDAGRWHEIVAINDLVPPFVTDDPAQANARVRLYGSQLIIPSATIQTSAASDPDRVFGIDVMLRVGRLDVDENGDLALIAGKENLRQAIMHRIRTTLGELLFHRNYGCGVHKLKGRVAAPTSAALGAQYVRGALLNDPRIDSVPASSAHIAADVNEISATARTVAGTSIDILSAV